MNLTRLAVKALPPTYCTLEAGRDAYLAPMQLRELAQKNSRYWKFYDQPTTIDLGNQCYAKSLSGFSSHTDEPSFRNYLALMKDYGIDRPSSYADAFHSRFHSPVISCSENRALAPAFAGAWQQALETGVFRGKFYRYDLCSAYAWALESGLPNTSNYRRCRRPWTNSGENGIYHISLLQPQPTAPFPFNVTTECLATPLEIETYNLSLSQVYHGIRWDSWIDSESVLKCVTDAPEWKCTARSYWGLWAQQKAVRCVTKSREWNLSNRFLNIPWAHLIVSRVKLRTWSAAKRILHAFVDSIITDDGTLATGRHLGDWRLEQVYERGLIIKGTGQYSALESTKFDKLSGVGRDDPRRVSELANTLTSYGYDAFATLN